MKKILMIAVCCMLLVVCGCDKKEEKIQDKKTEVTCKMINLLDDDSTETSIINLSCVNDKIESAKMELLNYYTFSYGIEKTKNELAKLYDTCSLISSSTIQCNTTLNIQNTKLCSEYVNYITKANKYKCEEKKEN